MIPSKAVHSPISESDFITQVSNLISEVRSTEDFFKINKLLLSIDNGEFRKDRISDFVIQNSRQNGLLSFLGSTDSIMGHISMKPFGYAGDFKIIDRIYTSDKSSSFEIWDTYSLSNSAAVAVRNRKTYFKTIVKKLLKEKGQLSILNLASGPCRDVKELFDEIDNPDLLDITCIDMDQRAIDYAQGVLGESAKKIKFVNKNILRFNPTQQFDLVWSAGLFDYFDDKVFLHLLKRARQWVSQDGSLVIGNFNEDHNPSRTYMELFGDWYLNHRTVRKRGGECEFVFACKVLLENLLF